MTVETADGVALCRQAVQPGADEEVAGAVAVDVGAAHGGAALVARVDAVDDGDRRAGVGEIDDVALAQRRIAVEDIGLAGVGARVVGPIAEVGAPTSFDEWLKAQVALD